MLLQFLYAIRGEALLMEQLNYNLLFRWFVGLNPDDEVWHATVFSKNRDRLLAGDRSVSWTRCCSRRRSTACSATSTSPWTAP